MSLGVAVEVMNTNAIRFYTIEKREKFASVMPVLTDAMLDMILDRQVWSMKLPSADERAYVRMKTAAL